METEKGFAKFFLNKGILLLENLLILSERIIAFLEKNGAKITHCLSHEEARVLTDLSFYAALFDLNLADGDSLELLGEGFLPQILRPF